MSEDDLKDKEKMNDTFEMMNNWQEEMIKYQEILAKEHGVTQECAGDIFYLRSRSRWTQEKEDRLIQSYKDGNPLNIFEDFK